LHLPKVTAAHLPPYALANSAPDIADSRSADPAQKHNVAPTANSVGTAPDRIHRPIIVRPFLFRRLVGCLAGFVPAKAASLLSRINASNPFGRRGPKHTALSSPTGRGDGGAMEG
jgi:hypothetical protein